MRFRERLQRVLGDAFLLDHARPFEWINLLMLSAWFQFLITHPDDFGGPRYPAFKSLSPTVWASIIGVIVVSQLFAMHRSRHAALIRFAAMTLATGIWTIIALSFWGQANTAPLSARENTVLALAAAATAIYLGLGWLGRR